MILPTTGILPIVILVATTFKNDRNGAFGENRQNIKTMSHQCQMRVDETFTKFVAILKGNFSRIYGNINEPMETSVSAC